MDLQNSDCVLIMGSNFAEAHPVGYRFVMRARERGAEVIHVDPRFSRTSATSTMYSQIRAGSDAAFLGGLINYVINSDRWHDDPFFKEYVAHYTNAANLVHEDFKDAAELGGYFSGWDEEDGSYDFETWQYEGMHRKMEQKRGHAPEDISDEAMGPRTGKAEGGPPPTDPTLEHPRCVFQVLKRHFSVYTPEAVESMTGIPEERFAAIAQALLENSGRERTSAIAYAVGWTQHTNGPQVIASAAILQLLLGNIGRPGGGIQALRGHATIQGSTDIPTLYDLLPGYLLMPSSNPIHERLDDYLHNEGVSTGVWAQTDAYMVSLMRAWWGHVANEWNEWGFQLMPRITGDHSHLPMFIRMHQREVEGLFLMGQNPAVGGQNARFQREAMGKLDWLVVRDFFETESASFWKDSPEVRAGEVDPEDIGTEVFLLPAASVLEKNGSFTNTQRLVQWHQKAVESPGDARSDAWFMHHLMRRVKAHYRDSAEKKDFPIQAITWDYPTQGPDDEPVIDHVLREINGYRWADGWDEREQLTSYEELEADGSTACGCWLYCGVHDGRNRAAFREKGDGYISEEWAFSWPANVRMLYNRCSADPEGRPWSERKKYIWWDESEGKWVGKDKSDFPEDKPPSYRSPGEEAQGMAAIPGNGPFVLKPRGRAWIFFPFGMKDGPLPAHYEPWETPTENPLYPDAHQNPATRQWKVPGNPYHRVGSEEYPHVLITYRLTEHHTGGGMTRWHSWLTELQPEAFVEIGPELAEAKGIEPGGWATVRTARGEAEARAMVTRRLKPLRIGGKRIHQVGFPWHFGYAGIARGGSANDLVSIVADPNVTIHEGKVLTCDIRAGRVRDRGPLGRAGSAGVPPLEIEEAAAGHGPAKGDARPLEDPNREGEQG